MEEYILSFTNILAIATLGLTIIGIILTIFTSILPTRTAGTIITLILLVWLAGISFVVLQTGAVFDHRMFYKVSSRVFGITKDKLSRTVDIRDDGSALSWMTMTLGAVSQDLSRVEHEYSLPSHPDSAAGSKVKIAPGPIYCGHYKLIPEVKSQDCRTAVYSLRIEPQLPKGQSAELNQPFEQTTPPGVFYGSLEELANANLPYDYSAIQLRYPTDHLTLELIFPPDFMVKDEDIDVWLGTERVRHKPEWQYLQKNRNKFFSSLLDDKTRRLTLKLDLPYPLWGLTYAIRWKPTK